MVQLSAKKPSLIQDKRALAASLALAVFVLFAWIGYASPLEIDDLGFWTITHTEATSLPAMLAFSLGYGNGRLLGNLTVLLLMRSQALRILVKAAAFTLIVLFLPHALHVRRYFAGAMLTLLLLLGMSPGTFAQTVVWTAGFGNYVPPLLLSVLGLELVRLVAEERRGVILLCAGAFLFGAAMQLFVEHSTGANVILAILLQIRASRDDKKRQLPVAFFLSGAFLGAAAMALIPEFFVHDGFVEGYRNSFLGNGLRYLLAGCVKNGVKLAGMFSENGLALLILSALQTELLRRAERPIPIRRLRILSALTLIPACVFLLMQIDLFSGYYGRLAIFESLIRLLLLGAEFIGLGWGAITLLRRTAARAIRLRLALADLLLALCLITIFPLLFVEPVGYRVLLHPYALLCAAAVVELDLVMEQPIAGLLDPDRLRRALALLCCLAVAAMAVHFADVNRMRTIREADIAAEVERGADVIDYFPIPSNYVYFYWNESTYSRYYSLRFGRQVTLRPQAEQLWFGEHYYHYYEPSDFD